MARYLSALRFGSGEINVVRLVWKECLKEASVWILMTGKIGRGVAKISTHLLLKLHLSPTQNITLEFLKTPMNLWRVSFARNGELLLAGCGNHGWLDRKGRLWRVVLKIRHTHAFRFRYLKKEGGNEFYSEVVFKEVWFSCRWFSRKVRKTGKY